VRTWDIATGRELRTLHGHTNWVWSVAYHPHAAILASGSFDETIRLWDLATGACLTTLRTPGPYAGLDIFGATGITEAQRAALRALGAVTSSDRRPVAGSSAGSLSPA
jgi:WD40 repeat protein